jgi:hypothetical protein
VERESEESVRVRCEEKRGGRYLDPWQRNDIRTSGNDNVLGVDDLFATSLIQCDLNCVGACDFPIALHVVHLAFIVSETKEGSTPFFHPCPQQPNEKGPLFTLFFFNNSSTPEVRPPTALSLYFIKASKSISTGPAMRVLLILEKQRGKTQITYS